MEHTVFKCVFLPEEVLFASQHHFGPEVELYTFLYVILLPVVLVVLSDLLQKLLVLGLLQMLHVLCLLEVTLHFPAKYVLFTLSLFPLVPHDILVGVNEHTEAVEHVFLLHLVLVRPHRVIMLKLAM